MVVKVGFSKGTTWVARLICYVTNTDISHSFFYVEDDAEHWVYEAVPGGFRKTQWDEYQHLNSVIALVEMEWPHSQVKRALDSMLGMKYNMFTFFVVGTLLLLRRRPARLWAQDGIDCVTSVLRVMREYAMMDPGEVFTPSELKEKIRRK